MLYKTSSENELELLNLPETGTGFQIVSAHYKTEYTQHTFLILNNTVIIEMDAGIEDASNKMPLREYKEVAPELEQKQLFDIELTKETKQFLLAEEGF